MMPKMTNRERLAKIEADQRSLAEEAEAVRRDVRAQYGRLTADLPVEALSEREFRDLIGQAIRIGGGAAVAALKTLPAPDVARSKTSPERRPGDEHGGAARRRPAPVEGAAAPGDGPGAQPGP